MGTNFSKTLHVLIGLGSLAIACADKPRPSTPTETVSTPASEREESSEQPSGDLSAPPPASSALPTDPTTRLPEGDLCAGMDCGEGYCDLHTVNCVTAPCPPVPTCVNGTHPCAVTSCITNSRCESRDGKAVCIPLDSDDTTPCGKSTCGADEVCCNASCGICTPPDGACTQQACAE